jgi:hypothetical protein
MRNRSHRDEDTAFRWAFSHSYKRNPSSVELERYKFWHKIERRRGFPRHWLSPEELAELEAGGDPGPWEVWPTRPIPTFDRKLISPPARCAVEPEPRQPDPSTTDSAPSVPAPASGPESALVDMPPKRRRRRGASARARELLRGQLANGPKPGAQIEALAETQDIPMRSLIVAADALGVRCRLGQWWLPG